MIKNIVLAIYFDFNYFIIIMIKKIKIKIQNVYLKKSMKK